MQLQRLWRPLATLMTDPPSYTGIFPAVTGYDLATGLRSPRCALINELILGAGAQGVGVGAPTTPATVTTEVFYQGQPAPQVISAPVTPQPFPLPAYAVFQPAGTLSSSAPIDHITVTLSPLASGVWDIDLIDIMTWSAGNGTCLVDQSGSPLIDASSGTLTFVPGSGCP